MNVTDPKPVYEIAQLTDLLPLQQPPAGPCTRPAVPPPTVDASFEDATGNTLAEANGGGDYGTVTFAVGGQPQYELSDGSG